MDECREKRDVRFHNNVVKRFYCQLGLSEQSFRETCRIAHAHYRLSVYGDYISLQDDRSAKRGADFLAQNALLYEAEGSFFVHDLVLDFIKIECTSAEKHELVKDAVRRQTRYLSRPSVVWEFDKREGLNTVSTDTYALIRLWRSLEELSGNEHLEVERYTASLGEVGQAESTEVADAHERIGKLLFRQVGC